MYSLEFIKWYSGMSEEKILKAHERYLKEKADLQPFSTCKHEWKYNKMSCLKSCIKCNYAEHYSIYDGFN
jgi:hypothetical protein